MILHQSGWFPEPFGHSTNTEKSDKYTQGDIFLNRLWTIPPLSQNRVGWGAKKFFFGKHKFFVITSQNLLTDRKKISGARRTVLLLLKRSFFKPYLFRWSKVFRRRSIYIIWRRLFWNPEIQWENRIWLYISYI